MSRATTSGPGKLDQGADGEPAELGQDLVHRSIEIDGDGLGRSRGRRAFEEPGRMPLDLLEEDALGRDLAAQAAVGVAGHAEADGARPGVARQADETGFVGEIAAAELGPEPGLPGQAHHALFPAGVPEGLAFLRAPLGQAVEEAGRGQLDRLERRSPARARRRRRRCGRAGRRRRRGPGSSRARNASSAASSSRALDSWKRAILLDEPPPLATKKKRYSPPSTAWRSTWAGRFVPVLTSSMTVSGAMME